MRRLLAAITLWAACLPAAASAQSRDTGGNYPTKPIRAIVDFPAGGLSDTLARTIAPKLTEVFGQPIIVDPRPGAGGLLAYGLAAKATPDGYTLAFISAPFSVNLNLFDKIPYDTLKDFTLISLVATAPNVLLANPAIPAKNASELIAYAKSRPAGLNFASVGIGSSPHLTGELFKALAHLNATHVPFNGSGPALTDLIAGRVDFMFVNYPAAAPLVKSGRLNLLATGGPRRLPAFPDVPTVAESGFPGFRSVGWYGIAAPGGTPKAVVSRLNAEIVRILKLDDVRERLINLGVDPSPSSPEEFRTLLLDEIKIWAKVIKDSGVKVQN